jgi:NAD(P)-dependent dehydrogenase (short-subunit alcohol dehydrogenase family)
MDKEKLFPDGCALVIGGTGGVGRAIVTRLVAAGVDVALTYRSNDTLAKALVADAEASGRCAAAWPLDVSNRSAVSRIVTEATARLGRIHTVIFAAAAYTHQVYLSQVNDEQWRAALDQDVSGFFNVVRETLPGLREGGGSYVNIGSVGTTKWVRKDGLSIVPKAAIEAMIQGIAHEEGRHGVRANSVLIGVVEAGMFLELQRTGVIDVRWRTETKKLLALKRWGKPEEIADAAVFMACSRAAYITGQQLSVAGGL